MGERYLDRYDNKLVEVTSVDEDGMKVWCQRLDGGGRFYCDLFDFVIWGDRFERRL